MKTKLDYTVRTTRAPGEQTDTYIPMIVDRIQPTALESVIEKCIDRGLIAGLKPTAAKTIAEGVAQQMAYEFAQGRGIQFGQYFYGRPYLTGKVESDGRLTSENGIEVRLYKGNSFALTRSDFSLSYIDGGNNPTITNVVSNQDGTARGDVVKGKKVYINGKMLYGAGDTVKVIFKDEAETNPTVEVTAFTAISSDLVAFDCPNALVSGAKYLVSVERTDANGVPRVSATKPVLVSGESADPEPIGQSEDGTVKVFSMTDQTGAEILTAGNNWRIDGEGLAPEGFTTEGWVLNSVRLEANGIDAEAVIVEGDSDKKHVVVRAESDIANPGDYEVTFHFDLQEYGSIESESFTVTQMIRVPQGA